MLTFVAAGLLAPVFASAALLFAAQSVFNGRAFTALAALGSVLPEDARTGLACFAALSGGSVCLVAVACARLPWLFPTLLLSVGCLAGCFVLTTVQVDAFGDTWVLGSCVAGIVLCAVQVRRVLQG